MNRPPMNHPLPAHDPIVRTADERESLAERYQAIRKFSERIVHPLRAEDCVIQSMPDASPQRWHLAHTTWFFETFVLGDIPGYAPFDASFEYLFNSYYNSVGEQFPRSRRGLISRPGLDETLAYRHHVDQALIAWLHAAELTARQKETLIIGLHHEQQHQELMLTDLKHLLSCNPLSPAYLDHTAAAKTDEAGGSYRANELNWLTWDEELVWIGDDTDGFAFDNERPRHRFFVHAFQLADRCVTNAEYLAFIEDGGYQRPEFWLSLGWDTVRAQNWQAPLYWSSQDGEWSQFTLHGRQPIKPEEPVCHVSYFEADAYARWANGRLPSEQEWEHAVTCELGTSVARGKGTVDARGKGTVDTRGKGTVDGKSLGGHGCDAQLSAGRSIHPQVNQGEFSAGRLIHALGNVWQWTASPYTAYPGYQTAPGALGEYNGKFMCNQFVLRGGSCASPAGHLRTTYRNFFPPETRWQFTGIRLAK